MPCLVRSTREGEATVQVLPGLLGDCWPERHGHVRVATGRDQATPLEPVVEILEYTVDRSMRIRINDRPARGDSL